jgi:transposase
VVADLPCSGRQVTLLLTVRKFVCLNLACPRVIFAERLAALVQPRARQTRRLQESLCALGFATSGQAAARLAPQLGMSGSPSTILRQIKATVVPPAAAATKVGLDDFAFRRGLCYGTMIVDLETHRVLDLLPDRTAATVSAWLKDRPWIVLISRDRGAEYAAAARAGAPQAIQVADRWHLLRNLSEALVLILARHRPQIRKASRALAPAAGARDVPEPPEPDLPPDLPFEDLPAPVMYGRPYRTAALQRAEEARRVHRLDRYEQMLALRAAQVPIVEIARQVGIDARTVRRWVAHESFPERRPRRRRPSLIDPYEASVIARWSAGCQNGMQLWEEVRAKGYQGSIRALYHYLFRLRDQATPAKEPPRRRARRTKPKKALPPPGPYDQFSAKHAVWLFVRLLEDLKATEREELTFLRQVHPHLDLAYQLTQEFVAMLNQHQADHLAGWIKQARGSHIPELVTFGRGLTQDEAAVRASLVFPHSQGVVEGHVNRLKLIKRMMYGRAGYALLRQRVLSHA